MSSSPKQTHQWWPLKIDWSSDVASKKTVLVGLTHHLPNAKPILDMTSCLVAQDPQGFFVRLAEIQQVQGRNNAPYYPSSGWADVACMLQGVARSDELTYLTTVNNLNVDDVVEVMERELTVTAPTASLFNNNNKSPRFTCDINMFYSLLEDSPFRKVARHTSLFALPICTNRARNEVNTLVESYCTSNHVKTSTIMIPPALENVIVSDVNMYFDDAFSPPYGVLWCLVFDNPEGVQTLAALENFNHLVADLIHAEWYYWSVTRLMLWRNANFSWNRYEPHLAALNRYRGPTDSYYVSTNDCLECTQCLRVWHAEYTRCCRCILQQRPSLSSTFRKNKKPGSGGGGKTDKKRKRRDVDEDDVVVASVASSKNGGTSRNTATTLKAKKSSSTTTTSAPEPSLVLEPPKKKQRRARVIAVRTEDAAHNVYTFTEDEFVEEEEEEEEEVSVVSSISDSSVIEDEDFEEDEDVQEEDIYDEEAEAYDDDDQDEEEDDDDNLDLANLQLNIEDDDDQDE
jgi:hypothetical protein